MTSSAYLRRLPGTSRESSKQRQPIIQLARFTQVGTLRTDVKGDRWLKFEASSQIVVPPAIGFFWNARVARARAAFTVRVRDALISGHGSWASEFSFRVSPSPPPGVVLETDSGALHRYLAEAVWYPTRATSERRPWMERHRRQQGPRYSDG